MDRIWEFILMQGKNPQHTGPFINGYDNRGFSPSQVFAREGCQNSSDAGKDVGKLTEVHIHWLKLCGEAKLELIELLDLDTSLRARLSSYEATQREHTFCESVKRLFNCDTMEFVLIRDFNTCGLGGRFNEYEKQDHFSRLVCALNLDDKSDDDASLGGSFGLGKTTYSNSSQIRTVVYHSVFQPTPDTDGVNRRMMTAGVYPKHDFEGNKCGGFAYYGAKNPERPGETIPLNNEAAVEVWDQISNLFEGHDLSRADDQAGTDILILQPTIDFDEVKTAIEDFYWPAIVERKLAVRMFDADGEVHHPNPIARPDLKPFIDLHRKIRTEEWTKKDTLWVQKLNKSKGKMPGCVAFEAVEDGDDDNKRNQVALMRDTGMVLNYAPLGAERFEPARGVFIANEDIQRILIASENMAHSEWDEKSRRLARNFPEEGEQLVGRVNRVIKDRFHEFQKNLQPNAIHIRNEQGFFARLMSGVLQGSTGNKQPGPGLPNPASISLIRRERVENLTTWRLRITDNDNTPDQEFKLTVKPSISIAGDAKRVALKRREVIIKDKEGNIIERGDRPTLRVDFQRGAVLDYLIELDAPGNFNYVVDCKCLAEIEVPDQVNPEPDQDEAPLEASRP